MIVDAMVEILKGSKYKYEIDIASNQLFLDRVIHLPYPASYGYFPGTLSEDGDPLDVFIISNESLTQSSICRIKILGAIKCVDEGDSDDKIIGILNGEQWESGSSEKVKEHTSKINSFLHNYKQEFQVIEVLGEKDAIEIYENSIKAFSDKLREDI